MVTRLWFHLGRRSLEHTVDVDRPWRDNVRSQIFCQNQEEKDYLTALGLMFGREIEVNIWDEWLVGKEPFMSMTDEGIKIEYHRPNVLPIAYTTWPVDLGGY